MKAKNQRMKRFQNFKPKWVPGGQFAPQPLGRGAPVDAIQNPRMEAFHMRRQGVFLFSEIKCRFKSNYVSFFFV